MGMRAAIEHRDAYYRRGVRRAVRTKKTDGRSGRAAQAGAKTRTTVVEQFTTVRCRPSVNRHLMPHIFHRIQLLRPGTIRVRRFESGHADFPPYREARWLPPGER